jgi:hypothetical protein
MSEISPFNQLKCFIAGENWTYGNQDGGLGNVGVVINVEANRLIVVRMCQF